MKVTVESSQRLIEGVQRMELSAPDVFRLRDPRCRAVLWLTAGGEQVPLTIAEVDPSRGTVTIVFKLGGPATEWLASRQPDEDVPGLEVLDLPTHARTRRFAMLAGGALALSILVVAALWIAPVIGGGGGRATTSTDREDNLAALQTPAEKAKPAGADRSKPRPRPPAARPAPAPEPPRDVAGLPPGVKPGFLSLLSLPACDVLVDEESVGSTPLIKYPLTPGEHAVRLLRKKDLLDQSFQVIIRQGKITQEHFRFTKGQIEFQGIPGLEIYLGQTLLGTTPVKPLTLFNGRYAFRAVDETLNKEIAFSADVVGERKVVIPIEIRGDWSPGEQDPSLRRPPPKLKPLDAAEGDFSD